MGRRLIFGSLLTLFVVWSSGNAADLYIVAIGVDMEAQGKQDQSAKDAKQFTKFLKTHAHPHYKAVHVAKFVGKRATYTKIMKRMNKMGQKLQVDDVMVVYISCHGWGAEEGYSVWTKERSVNGKALVQFMNITKGKMIFVLDTCHSGALMNAMRKWNVSNPNVAVFASSRVKEASWGLGGKDRKPLNGFFSSAVMLGLQRRHTVNQLQQYLSTKHWKGQHPVFVVPKSMRRVVITGKKAS